MGADIIMCLDDVKGYPVGEPEALDALERTTRWARRCLEAKKKVDPALFGIVQGSMFSDLRRQSADGLTSLDLDGYAIGGLSVGEPHEIMVEMMEVTVPLLPEKSPRYVMGIGKPQDILGWSADGEWICFDCVLPTRNARNGMLFTSQGSLNIRNARYAMIPGRWTHVANVRCAAKLLQGLSETPFSGKGDLRTASCYDPQPQFLWPDDGEYS